MEGAPTREIPRDTPGRRPPGVSEAPLAAIHSHPVPLPPKPLPPRENDSAAAGIAVAQDLQDVSRKKILNSHRQIKSPKTQAAARRDNCPVHSTGGLEVQPNPGQALQSQHLSQSSKGSF
ncbi:hypothetical protein MC885_011247, partial [Smutsia gigantea]